MTPKKLRRELHSSPNMREMIAELSLGYMPQLIVLDGVEAFVDGGPSMGTKKEAEVFLGGTDLVAAHVVGIAVLKELGSSVCCKIEIHSSPGLIFSSVVLILYRDQSL